MQGVMVYRELSDPSPSLVAWLDARDQLFVVQDPSGKEHAYIDNDTPRDSDITDEIVGNAVQAQVPHVGCTKGFALFTADGDYIASFATLDRALKAKADARITTVPVVEGVEAEDVGWDSVQGVHSSSKKTRAAEQPTRPDAL